MIRRPAIALILAGLAVASCQSGEAPGDPSSGATHSRDWGPLAVAESTGGDEALITGTVRITDACALLEEGEERVLLVWPEPHVDWLGARNAIQFASGSGDQIVLQDGETVTFSGGGSTESEDGLARDDFLESMVWVARPHPDCVASSRWSIADIVVSR